MQTAAINSLARRGNPVRSREDSSLRRLDDAAQMALRVARICAHHFTMINNHSTSDPFRCEISAAAPALLAAEHLNCAAAARRQHQ